MREMKYIVMQDSHGTETIVIFPKTINHDCMAEVASRIRNQTHGNWERVFRKPISAGFTDGKTCYGESFSLGIESRPQDTELL